jgi:hypothetical protein
MLTSNAIVKRKAIALQTKARTSGSFVRKDKSPSKSKKSSSSKQSSKKPSIHEPVFTKEYLKKLYLKGDDYLDTFPAPKTLNRAVVKGYDLN